MMSDEKAELKNVSNSQGLFIIFERVHVEWVDIGVRLLVWVVDTTGGRTGFTTLTYKQKVLLNDRSNSFSLLPGKLSAGGEKKCSINFVSGKVPFFREWWKKDKSENDCHRTPQAGTTTTEKFLCLFLSRSRACLKLIQFILILPHTARLKNKHNRVELILVFFPPRLRNILFITTETGREKSFFFSCRRVQWNIMTES